MTSRHGVLGCWVMIGLSLGTTHVYAQCVAPELKDGVAGYSACKAWPAYPGVSITASSQLEAQSATENPYDEGTYDLRLALVASEGGAALATYSQASSFNSDAISFNGLSIDTARYSLTPQLRAFGIRAAFRGSSRANPFGEAWLSLYVKEGNTLRPVLESLVVESYGGEWDTNCEGEFHETRRTLQMAKSSSHGYADLIVKTQSSGSTNVRKGEECVSVSRAEKPAVTTLRYDGKQYVVPEGLKGRSF
ncbi:hypothetical protein IF690_07765 [Pseudomonas sp. SK3(2021)]|uniref:hypothetical protein n=1 Tax=Pseudomonas sp. SK3(2021) TaxID=2841064 RepID=UPI00192B31F0|nr:hypothetical protein [Pseudomonas sp. SK3(2021)]QQZ43425.1 hypothetical protein IF690_07765 [Pseudomonas sp. SK3(2021)]